MHNNGTRCNKETRCKVSGHDENDDDDDEHNGEKVDFKDLLCGIEPSLPPAQPPLLVVDSATKTAFGSRDGGWGAVACLDQARLSGRG